jgi:DNA-binding NarL/FixJ family response regulator
MMRVLLADDHSLLAEGLSNMLAAHKIEVVGVAADGLEAIEMAETLHPDLILMDIRMPRCDGLQATRRIKTRQPEIKIVMLTTSVDEADLFEAIKSGACGYLLKSIRGTDFIDALRGLEQGTPPFSLGMASMLLDEFARLSKTATGESSPIPSPALSVESLAAEPAEGPSLTDRQTEVLRLVAAGLTYKEVGVRLSISERTVRYHMAEMMQRLHLEHRSQVIAFAGRSGLKDSD